MTTPVDVAVIGGGMAGMSIAAELAATRSVLVLEQEAQLAHHATGRSAAAFLESYGGPEIRALTRASRPLLEAAAVDAPLLAPRPLLWVAGPGRERAVAELCGRQAGLVALGPADVRQVCPALRPDWVSAAAVEPDAQDLDVAGLHQSYVRAAGRGGVAVARDSRLLAATHDGQRWHLHHAGGTVVAPVVVNAAGAWADAVAGLFGAPPCGLRPLRRTIVIARTGSPVPGDGPLVADVDDGFYFRPEGPHVLLSPADETPSEPCDARPDEADVALALERVNEATTLGLRSVVTTWAGLRTFAPDRVPVVGYDPRIPGLLWLAGQGGYGIQTAPALARLAATLLTGERSPAAPPIDLDLAALSPARFRPPQGSRSGWP
ncbi:MAG TPA: FAD-dependent oxidoreductase [Acidimicrobiales bacterium]|nr:FAD-dependent oxidoreductase [Acidimicrobiales bacterium]